MPAGFLRDRLHIPHSRPTFRPSFRKRAWDAARHCRAPFPRLPGGESSVWFGGAATATLPGQIHGSGANGTIGTGPGLAIGAWVANRKPVLWYTGDGSFGFYPMELETMARYGVPVVCVI
ncbi:MAG: hypothetical protein HUJ31_02930, partial [Pseudomonadales bacterium]|nr:hypothetical protein [Pseudomonadales bacterium]